MAKGGVRKCRADQVLSELVKVSEVAQRAQCHVGAMEKEDRANIAQDGFSKLDRAVRGVARVSDFFLFQFNSIYNFCGRRVSMMRSMRIHILSRQASGWSTRSMATEWRRNKDVSVSRAAEA